MVIILENMIEISQRIFFIFIFLFSSIAYSQTLFIPLSDPYIISIYKTGEKSQDGTYISKDSLGNIRIKGKFNGIKPIGKWYVFFESGELNSNYAYNDNGNLDGLFVEYYNNGQIKSAGYFENNVQTSTWKTFYYDGIIETEGELLEGKRYKQWNYYFPSGKIKEVSNYNFKGELSGILISYDEFGKKVSEANYINNKLNGSVPESISNLQLLKGLDLRNNQLTSLPSTICDLPSDCVIKVSGNQLCEEYQYDCIGNWAAQDSSNCDCNGITGGDGILDE